MDAFAFALLKIIKKIYISVIIEGKSVYKCLLVLCSFVFLKNKNSILNLRRNGRKL